MTRNRQAGVSLLNVLAILAVGTGLVQVMLSDQDVALQRLASANDVAQAQSLARSGITSVAVTLRRDFGTAPLSDHPGEPWADAAQERIALDFGQYDVSIVDGRGMFDLNALHPAALAEQRVFAALLTILGLPETLAGQITQIITQNGPLRAPQDLVRLGIAQGDIDRLAPHVTATPVRGPMNLNTVTEPLMAALLSNPPAARGLIARRAAKGFLDASDLSALGVPLPPLAGFTSDVFDVTANASVGVARAALRRRLLRDPDSGAVQSIPLQ
ncbi:type II secretion system protein GspK [uncultured Tateyamaria sp.]|uniref:general secretion pathway protein GspK n=1 Tax=uncultured Tateyamaria sp. TaxID=455651 RepID=UPI002633E281|nr:type II secretion system protein GspK [uncultured Tateyamaria sp.]